MNNSLKRRVEGSLYAVQLLSLIASKDLEDADYMDGLVERMIRDGSHTAIEEVITEKPEPSWYWERNMACPSLRVYRKVFTIGSRVIPNRRSPI